MPATLIATIGTRDLMFQTQSGDWYNIGDDQLRGTFIGEQAEVLADLGQDLLTFRDLTQFLATHIDDYRSRIRPVITGQLFRDRATDIDQVYLIGTDQPATVSQRDKDTLYACQLFQDWFVQQHPHINVEIVRLGTDGTNPSDFEAMFRWWQRTWPTLVNADSTAPIWLCIKGGVGQTSESGRISGLSRYGDRIQFFEFQQRRDRNRQGLPSDYTGPFAGTYYLWNRAQQQALTLLDRYDYAGAAEVLQPYIQQDAGNFGAVPTWLQAGMAWNRGEFHTFYQRLKSVGATNGQPEQLPWWMAYEQAQLAVIRLYQENTAEAMLHSFRAIEGAIWLWLEIHIPEHIIYPPQRYPQLQQSIVVAYPSLAEAFENRRTGEPLASINLNGYNQQLVLEAALPAVGQSIDMRNFWSQDNRNQRNALSHRLGGLSERELLAAWGRDIQTLTDWQRRMVNCLNLLTGKSATSLAEASLLMQMHPQLQQAIATYEP
ncbi:hypothetical protein [Halomicronema sp. CCY15110]|uniref:hypothetical protein n=1 Tax=Halomicronema sp. CCY15110 TaxID=2767773 RepID=UPI001951EF30|nr:hypothetical protein [Halomicronema sp. CCY15110]